MPTLNQRRLLPPPDLGETPVTIASRLDPTRLRQVGVRGYVEELLAALDGTAVPCKLQAAGLAGLLLGGLFALAQIPFITFALDPLGFGWLLLGLALVVLGWLVGILSRTTYVELSRLRPSTWKDALAGAAGLTTRLAAAYALVGGIVGGLITLLRWLPGWCHTQATGSDALAWTVAGHLLAVLGVPAELGLWLLLVLLLPLGALLVVEECSVVRGLWQWLRLVRQHCIRLLVVEALAMAFAALLAVLPALLLVVLWAWTPQPTVAPTVEAARDILAGLFISLPLAYLLVANVFIYLNVRYGASRTQPG